MKFSLRKRKVFAALCAATLTFLCPASYATYSCTGTVQQVEVTPTGDVLASFNFSGGNANFMNVCNINSQAVVASPAVCKSMLSVLIDAQATQQPTTLWFSNTTGTCTFTAWTSLTDYGWYSGPSVASHL